MEIRVNNRYRLGPKIGSGATGVVHQGTQESFVNSFVVSLSREAAAADSVLWIFFFLHFYLFQASI